MTSKPITKSSLDDKPKMPLWFRIIFALLFIWAVFFGYVYYITNFLSEAQIQSMSEANRALYLDIPSWAIIGAGIGVVCSILGILLILFGKKRGAYLLIITPITAILRDGWFLYDGRVLELITTISLILASLAVILSIIQVFLAFYGVRKKWLK